ncbi:hypothetical protein EDB83DRAFT_741805 [Lactarius deliciosus]|nr:hypothetical protein EDB83DRAFT_741805 [Lactarius deliciosus]
MYKTSRPWLGNTSLVFRVSLSFLLRAAQLGSKLGPTTGTRTRQRLVSPPRTASPSLSSRIARFRPRSCIALALASPRLASPCLPALAFVRSHSHRLSPSRTLRTRPSSSLCNPCGIPSALGLTRTRLRTSLSTPLYTQRSLSCNLHHPTTLFPEQAPF